MFAKTVLALSTVAILAGSSAALAQVKRTDQLNVTSARHFDTRAAFVQSPQLPWNGIVGDAVIRDGQLIGRDLDFNVRLQMYRDRSDGY